MAWWTKDLMENDKNSSQNKMTDPICWFVIMICIIMYLISEKSKQVQKEKEINKSHTICTE